MKKFMFLITNSEYESFIENIRQLGVIHVDDLQHGASSPELQHQLDLLSRCNKAIIALENVAVTSETRNSYNENPVDLSRYEDILNSVDNFFAEEIKVKHEIENVEKNIEILKPWGDIDWDRIQQLRDAGLEPSFFTCPTKMFSQKWIDKYSAIPVATEGKREWFVAFNVDASNITAQELQLPEMTLTSYKSELDSLNDKLLLIREDLMRIYSEDMPTLKAAQLQTQNDIDLCKVQLSHETICDDSLSLLIGWTLADECQPVMDYLDKNHIYYEMSDPEFEDEVPIKIKNNKFAELFEPILRMYSLPNYHDIDPLPLFAPFFMLFFGLCMGDAGYGLIITAIGLAVTLANPDFKKFGILGVILGVMTTICGGITGTFFGIDLAQVDWNWIKPLQPYFVNDSMKEHFFGYSPMMVVSVIIGLVQVLIGMTMAGMKAVKNYGFIYGVGKFSWVTALLSAVVLFGFPMFGVTIPLIIQYVLYALIAISAFGIYFLNNPAAYAKEGSLKKILGVGMNLGGGLWATYGMSTGLLGDLLSYIRLFALGLTGGVLGSVFNSLAVDMSPAIPVVHEIVMLLILLFGHGINFGLCMISSFVHPMRLTFVEYFKNAEFDGGGKEYKPFKMHNA